MRLEIFDVEHGQCALLTNDNGERLMLDCGHNSATGWRPSTHLAQLGVTKLDWLVVTNYDEDHVSDLPNLRATVSVQLLSRNRSVNGASLKLLKSEHGCGNGIDELAGMLDTYVGTASSLPNFGGMTLKTFCNNYPNDFTDENNLSLVSILWWDNFRICFPGDMEKAGWKKLLERQDFRDAMSGVHVLVASHHGRESGCCDELFSQTGMKPQIVVISDGDIQYKSQATVNWYASKATGLAFNGSNRNVFTTRSDGKINFDISASRIGFTTGA
jgi:beta-lactamase superfamily II metal-dependent hydrolase